MAAASTEPPLAHLAVSTGAAVVALCVAAVAVVGRRSQEGCCSLTQAYLDSNFGAALASATGADAQGTCEPVALQGLGTTG